jgi:hypothetical protein
MLTLLPETPFPVKKKHNGGYIKVKDGTISGVACSDWIPPIGPAQRNLRRPSTDVQVFPDSLLRLAIRTLWRARVQAISEKRS